MPDYALEGAKWSSTNVTYSFATSTYANDASAPFSNAITGNYQGSIQWALQQWASVTPLTFTQVADSHAADIRIGTPASRFNAFASSPRARTCAVNPNSRTNSRVSS